MLKSGPAGAKLVAQLAEIGDARVAEMDAAGLDMQVLSLNSPGVEQSEAAEAIALARDANDLLAAAVRKYPKRFAGLAALPMGAPEQAAEELERCVRQLGFKGANINGHNRGRYLDDPFYAPVLARAEALNVPLYLHPTLPPAAVMQASYGGFSPAVTFMIRGAGLGLAHRDRHAHHAHDLRRRVRPSSETANGDRPYGRGAALHDAAHRGGGQVAAAGRRLEEAARRLSRARTCITPSAASTLRRRFRCC